MKLYQMLLLAITFACFQSRLYCQNLIDVFGDYQYTDGGVICDMIKDSNSVVIAGSTYDSVYVGYSNASYRLNYRPYIKRIGESGTTLWSIVPYDSSNYSTANSKATITNIVKSGNHIYGYFVSSNARSMFKVNYSDGKIVWNRPMPNSYAHVNGVGPLRNYWCHLIEYDSTKLVLTYIDPSSTTYHKNLATFIDKQNGDTLSTHKIGRTWGRSNHEYAVSKDSMGHLFYTSYDTLYKTSHVNHDSIIWKSSFDSLGVGDFQRIYIDAQDNIFVFGSKQNSSKSHIIKVNSTNGAPIWHNSHTFGHSIMFQDFEEKSGYLYTIWRQRSICSMCGGWNIQKTDKATGLNIWAHRHRFGTSYEGQSAMDLDLDSAGDIYLTGYTSGNGPGNWGIMKLQGITGNILYRTTVTLDSTQSDMFSWGLGAAVLNQKPCFFGELQTTYNYLSSKYREYFVQLNPATGQKEIEKSIGGRYQYTSNTIAIKPLSTGGSYVLRQNSGYLEAQKYDINNGLLWTTPLKTEGKVIIGKDLAIDGSGDALVMSYKTNSSLYTPFYGVPDSVYVYRIGPAGNIKNLYKFDHTSRSNPFELQIDPSGTLYVLYKNYTNEVYIRSLNSNGFGSNISLGFDLDTLSFSPKLSVNYSPTHIMVFGRSAGVLKAIRVTKNPLSQQAVANVPFLQRVNHTQSLNVNEAILCGKSLTGGEAAVRFDIQNLDTMWAVEYANIGEIKKLIMSVDSSHIYTISDGTGNSVLRKISTSSGQEIWSASLSGVAKDIVMDITGNQILVAGTQKLIGSSNIWGEAIDTSGVSIGTFTYQGKDSGHNSANCIASLSNGSVWVGGSIGDTVLRKAGFLMSVNSANRYFSSIADTACDSYTSPSGSYNWDSTGSYVDTIFSGSTVDTIIGISLTIVTTDTSVTKNGFTLTAAQSNASYQWLDCANGFSPISGANSVSYSPVVDGSYAVAVNLQGCIDTSSCTNVQGLNNSEFKISKGHIEVYPNPTDGELNISVPSGVLIENLVLFNASGQVIKSIQYSGWKSFKVELPNSPGTYFLQIRYSDAQKEVIPVFRK